MNYKEEYTPEQVLQELRATFREEAYELLAELESALLELEKTPGNKELIGRAFRAMHTIKGSGSACEFSDIVVFTHELESIFDQVRNGRVIASKEIIDLILAARDQIRAMFDRYYKGGSADESAGMAILDALRERVPVSKASTSALRAPARPAPGGSASATYRIRFRPSAEVLRGGTNPLLLLDELRGLGKCKIVAQMEDIPCLEDMDAYACHIHWDAILTTDRGRNAIEDVFIFVKDSSELQIDIVDTGGSPADEITHKRLGEILLERGDVSNEELQKVLQAKKRVGEMLVETGAVTPEKIESALAEQQHVRDIGKERRIADEISSVRVHSHKLDTLVNLVGELVTVQARLTQAAGQGKTPLLLSIAEEVERLSAELRDNAMSIRMLPIGTIFSKFKRLVRELSRNLGKEVELETDGSETELDKTVIERLHDPLMHLIRNSIDHSIELPQERADAGKSRQGTVRLSAVHSGAQVLIRIQDDGKGIDTDAVRDKALERGLISPDAVLSEKDLFEIIFSPGFSTARAVSDVSGRGVGLDVVKQAVVALRGTVEIENIRGRGTTLTLSLPLTLAIIDGFLTKIGDEHFVFPLSLVSECVELTAKQLAGSHGRDLLNVRGTLVPYIRLRDRFGLNGSSPEIEQVVVTNVDGTLVGFVVDRALGGHQTVIKSLGNMYRKVVGVSGATILGDGSVALILDIPRLVQSVERKERAQ